jgi:two-component system response regulator FixJ
MFVVSGDEAIRDSISELAASEGFRVEAFASLGVWCDEVGADRAGCLVLDARSGDLGDLHALGGFGSVCAGRCVVLLVDRGDVPTAVRAIRGGAMDVLETPFRDDRLLESIRHAATRHRTFEGR